jgi:hypothetical protein
MSWLHRKFWLIPSLLALPLQASGGEGTWTSSGPQADISALAISLQPPFTLVAAGRVNGEDADSVFTRLASEATWTERAQASPGVTITALTFDPSNPTTVYAAGSVEGNPPAGSLYISCDNGVSWSFLHLFPKAPVYAVAVDPVDSSKIFVGGSICTGSPSCSAFVSRSVDYGNSWSSTPTFAWAQSISGLAISPSEPIRLYAATDHGVLYSGDSGTTWVGQFGSPDRSPQHVEIACLAFSPADPETIYVGWHTPPCGFFQNQCNGPFGEGGAAITRNGGDSWTLLNPPMQVRALAITPANSKLIYAASDIGPGGVFKSVDGGMRWLQLGDLPGTAVIQLDPLRNVIYAATSAGVFEYEDNPLNPPKRVTQPRSVRDLTSRR